MRDRSRGQAMVELALALTVFITVVMFGIHFAEVGYLSVRVHEAAVSPLWDATALRTHRMMPKKNKIGDFKPVQSIPPRVMQDANNRYRDFDGRRSTNGSASRAQVFTKIDGLQVECDEDGRVEFDVPRGQRPGLVVPDPGSWSNGMPNRNYGNPNDSVLDGIYENVGGVSCSAEAHMETLPSLPTSFLEGATGFFQEQHARLWDMKVCASGGSVRVNKKCKGAYAVLLGDYAFADTDVSGHCPLRPEEPDTPCTENETYYTAVQKVFDANERAAGKDATDFARFFAGYSPIDEDGFFMSYRGVEDGYVEPLTPPGEPDDNLDRERNTGGVDHRPTPVVRPSNKCFLGLQGC